MHQREFMLILFRTRINFIHFFVSCVRWFFVVTRVALWVISLRLGQKKDENRVGRNWHVTQLHNTTNMCNLSYMRTEYQLKSIKRRQKNQKPWWNMPFTIHIKWNWFSIDFFFLCFLDIIYYLIKTVARPFDIGQIESSGFCFYLHENWRNHK